MQTIEERLDQLEKRNKRLTAALTLMAVAMCAVVTVAATGDKDGHFRTVCANSVYATSVIAKNIFAKNDEGHYVVTFGANDDGNGLVYTTSREGNMLVTLNSGTSKQGYHIGTVKASGFNEESVKIGGTENGGTVYIYNKTGENKETTDDDRTAT